MQYDFKRMVLWNSTTKGAQRNTEVLKAHTTEGGSYAASLKKAIMLHPSGARLSCAPYRGWREYAQLFAQVGIDMPTAIRLFLADAIAQKKTAF
jgi:hypothetical protein